jgi:bacillolysin
VETPAAKTCKTTTLAVGSCLEHGDCVVSANGCFKLIMQTDGNLVLYRVSDGFALWNSQTAGTPTLRACMQGDGNFVTYSGTLEQPTATFNTVTAGHPGATLEVEDDGHVVIYEAGSPTVLWSVPSAVSPPSRKMFNFHPIF